MGDPEILGAVEPTVKPGRRHFVLAGCTVLFAAVSATPSGSQPQRAMVVENFAELARVQFASDTNWVRTKRYGPIEAGGALYRLNHPSISQSLEGFHVSTSTDGRLLTLVETTLSPEMFGAVGNGIEDDYIALRDLARCASGRYGLSVRFAKGATYRVGQHRITGPKANEVHDIVWRDTQSLTIDMNGSKVRVDGDFYRAADLDVFPYSYTNSVQVFLFEGGQGLRLCNGEIDGNVEQMTKFPVAGEGSAFGVQLRGVDDYRLENLYIHHWATDGIYLTGRTDGRGGSIVSSRGIMREVRCHFNARQGMSVAGARGLSARNCSFSYTGYVSTAHDGTGVLGKYGFHAPGSGVDIEPEIPNPDYETGDLLFENCVFEENHGWPSAANHAVQVKVGGWTPTSSVCFDNCVFRCRTRAGTIWFFNRCFNLRNSKLENVGLWPSYGSHGVNNAEMRGEIVGNTWTGSVEDLVMLAGGNDGNMGSPALTIRRNIFIVKPRVPYSHSTRPISLDLWPQVRFIENEITVSRGALVSPFADYFPYPYVATLGVGIMRGNSWKTTGPGLLGICVRSNTVASNETATGNFGLTLMDTGRLLPAEKQPFSRHH